MVTNNSKALKSIASGIADMEPEAGWHPSHPVVEPMELRRQSQTCLSFALTSIRIKPTLLYQK